MKILERPRIGLAAILCLHWLTCPPCRSGEPPPGSAFPLVRLAREPGGLKGNEAVFLLGRRAAVETFLKDDRLGRTAFAPLDAFNSFEVHAEPPLALAGPVVCSPAGIEKSYAGPDGITARSTWRADAERPFFSIVYEVSNGGPGEKDVRLTARVVSNVGWVNKFAPHPDDLAAAAGGTAAMWDARLPRLRLEVEMDPPADRVEVGGQAGTKPASQPATLARTLRVAPGDKARLSIVLRCSDDPADLAAVGPAATPRSFAGVLAGAARLECPSPALEELYRACAAWPAANVRVLPFGPPHQLDGMANRRWPVITASPDYHGIFANDCIQTLWEAGLLGEGLWEPARNSVETMFRYGPRESVEWWTGDGRVWMFPAPLGDTPQVVLGACWHLLWTGDRELARRWWPDLVRCLKVLDDNDSDGDSLEDRPNTPYPEQPDPGPYNHEMLYVQCFWRQAYRKAADVAGWMGLPEAPALAERSRRIAAAIEEKFATPYGLAVWLDRDHRPHPHIGHEQIIAAAAGDVSDAPGPPDPGHGDVETDLDRGWAAPRGAGEGSGRGRPRVGVHALAGRPGHVPPGPDRPGRGYGRALGAPGAGTPLSGARGLPHDHGDDGQGIHLDGGPGHARAGLRAHRSGPRRGRRALRAAPPGEVGSLRPARDPGPGRPDRPGGAPRPGPLRPGPRRRPGAGRGPSRLGRAARRPSPGGGRPAGGARPGRPALPAMRKCPI